MKPFLSGKKKHSAAPLRPAHTHHAAPMVGHVTPAPNPNGSAAVLDVVKEGDKIVRLVITCGCGERIEVDCLYPAGS